MRILIIGQWILPMNNPRAHRTFNLAKGFARHGHEVILYSMTGEKDYHEEAQRYNIKIKNLGKSYCGLIDSQGKFSGHIVNRLLGRVVGEHNVYPGFEFYRMVKQCFQNETDIELLITIAFPHVIHWAAAKYIDLLAPKCWIADCGDPFMGNTFLNPLKIYERFEKLWCSKVNYITVPIEDAISAYYPEFRDKIRVIPQGFDNSDVILDKYEINDIPTFAFAGSTYRKLRDPRNFLNYIYDNDINCKFIVYTRSDDFDDYKEKLGERLDVRSYIQRESLIRELSHCDFLINIKNESSVQSPSKLIDYALTHRPILTITSDFNSVDQSNFLDFLNAEYNSQTIVKDQESYDIDNVVEKFTELYKTNRSQ